MFSVEEKKKIAAAIEKVILELKHPEMPSEKPMFKLHVEGKQDWSWADIEPNWIYEDAPPHEANPWNEVARNVLKHNNN